MSGFGASCFRGWNVRGPVDARSLSSRVLHGRLCVRELGEHQLLAGQASQPGAAVKAGDPGTGS